MKLILQKGEVNVDMTVLMENFKFFDMFGEMGMTNDDSFDMTQLPLTKEVLSALITLGSTGELDTNMIQNTLFLRSLIHANMYLDANAKITNLIENGHVYNRSSLYESCPDMYHATVNESRTRKSIAQGDVKPFTSLIEITEDVCKSIRYKQLDTHCPLLLNELSVAYGSNEYKTKYNADDYVMKLRNSSCETIKEILSLGNIVVAGGYVLELLANEKTKAGDVDIFIWGVSETEADAKLQKISDILCGDPYFTGNSYTFANRYDKEKGVENVWTSQVILRLYQSPDEILHGFDIQACKVLLCMDNGTYKFYGTQSFLESMRYNSVWIDTERQSSTYAIRLLKYYSKGFNVLMTGYNKNLVTDDILQGNIVDKKGLALLLRYEHEIIRRSPRGLYMGKKGDYESLTYTIKKILRKQKLPDSDYQQRISIFKKGIDMFNFLRRGWNKHYFPNYYALTERMGWRWVKRGTTKLPKATWNKRDPSSQTIIGSFHPEQEQYYNQAFGMTSFSVFVMDNMI